MVPRNTVDTGTKQTNQQRLREKHRQKYTGVTETQVYTEKKQEQRNTGSGKYNMTHTQ